jgi:hypothetical protein
MRILWGILLLALVNGRAGAYQNHPVDQDFPLRVTIDRLVDAYQNAPASLIAESTSMGMAPPGLVMFWGAIDGRHNWIFQCRKENPNRESIPCTALPVGEYRGRWVHDYNTIQLVREDSGGPITRFLDVQADPKNPPSSDDPTLQAVPFDFRVPYPEGKSGKDYSLLVHVYSSLTLSLPDGELPAHTSCKVYSWTAIQTSIDCMSTPPVELHRGYVDVNFGVGTKNNLTMHCEAKWRWSRCSALEPGFYYGRIEKDRIVLLTHDAQAKPHEVGFEFRPPESKTVSPIK